MMEKALGSEHNFLGIDDPSLCSYENARVAIQQVPYEYTSSYVMGSSKGPAAIVDASHYVEFYDEELDQETYKLSGIATLQPIDFTGVTDEAAVALIEEHTDKLLNDGKFVVSLGAEHTVTLGFVKSHLKKYPTLSVLQIDAHSDLRFSYHDNIYSHASVMARVHELDVNLVQIGIRAQCREEAELIRNSNNIHTFYAHRIRKDANWMEEAITALGDHVYISIDADGFDPAIVPAVGTAEPNGMLWSETLEFLSKVAASRKVVGFDVVEIAPREGDILSEFTMAKLVYRLLGYIQKSGQL